MTVVLPGAVKTARYDVTLAPPVKNGFAHDSDTEPGDFDFAVNDRGGNAGRPFTNMVNPPTGTAPVVLTRTKPDFVAHTLSVTLPEAFVVPSSGAGLPRTHIC